MNPAIVNVSAQRGRGPAAKTTSASTDTVGFRVEVLGLGFRDLGFGFEFWG